MIYGHATNTSANGIYKITKIDADKFSLQDRYAGTNIGSRYRWSYREELLPTVVPMQDYHTLLSFITDSDLDSLGGGFNRYELRRNPMD